MAIKSVITRCAVEKQFSIGRARNHLPRIVHEVEQGSPIELTRRGKPVAVIVSAQDYQRLAAGRLRFWDALEQFRRSVDPRDLAGDAETFGELRDPLPGRDFTW